MTRKSSAGKRPRPPTSFDVARLAGVSRSAVSRAFTDGASVAPETRTRVLEAARQLHYQPSNVARTLNTSRSQVVALAVSHLDNQFYPPLVEHFVHRLDRHGYRVMLFVTGGERGGEPLLDDLLRQRVDGLVLASSAPGSALLAGCQEVGLPVVMVNNAPADSTLPRVVGANSDGAAAVARFLMAGGHQRYGVIAGIPGVPTSEERLAAFTGALKAAGGPAPVAAHANFTFDGAFDIARALLSGPGAPDALFCVNDHMAFAACQAAMAVGRTPGRDVSVVGFDDVEIARWPVLALTTYAQPVAAMAVAAADLIREVIGGEVGPAPRRVVAGRLVVRGSARRPAGGIVPDADGAAVWLG